MAEYLQRVVDNDLDDLLRGAPAIAIEGPKGVGKTASTIRRARTVYALDDAVQRQLLEADPGRLDRDASPILLDEWQRLPYSWDLVRRAVDRDPRPGRFLLTGSAVPLEEPVHSGAGRIVTVRMRPLSLAERFPSEAVISLSGLLTGERPPIGLVSELDLAGYSEEVLASGFPAIRATSDRTRRALLDGYVERIAQRDFKDQGHPVRRPEALLAWMRAYAAATATNTSYTRILDAATPGEADKPARSTTEAYRHVLGQIWILDPIPAWLPTRSALQRLGQAPKHHLADPALAARLLGLNKQALLSGEVPDVAKLRDGSMMGRLFESLVTLSVRVYAQAAEARVHHLRTKDGDREIDLVVERDDGRVLAIEVKLSPVITDSDVRHLSWLRTNLGSDLLDAIVITAGREGYRRKDGIGIVPAAGLGP